MTPCHTGSTPSQVNTWTELTPSGTLPVRSSHTAVGSDPAQGFYVFGGFADRTFRGGLSGLTSQPQGDALSRSLGEHVSEVSSATYTSTMRWPRTQKDVKECALVRAYPFLPGVD